MILFQEAGSTVTTNKNKIEVRDKTEKETQAVKIHQVRFFNNR